MSITTIIVYFVSFVGVGESVRYNQVIPAFILAGLMAALGYREGMNNEVKR